MIRIQNMIFDYDNFRALHNVDVQIEAGSVTALVGANGSGKTTLMRCLVGLELPLSGDIFVNDVNVLESPREAHQYIGYLSDSFGLDRELTVEQCLTYTAGIQKYPQEQIKSAVEETIDFLDLKEKRTTKTKYLSRGQRQRVAIGQAIIHDPLLLVMDEPASGLDPEQRENLAVIFKKLHQKGVTILVSSHILAELDEYSTHILVLQKGRVIEYRAINAASAARIFQIKILNADIYEKLLEETLNRFKAEHNVLLTFFKQQDKVLLETDMGDDLIAELLKSIMEQAIPLVEFSPHKHNLKDIYQHSTKGGARS